MSQWFRTTFAIFILTLSVSIQGAERPLQIPHLDAELETDKSVTWGQLDNGMIYAVMPNLEPKDKVSLRMYVRVGSMQELEAERGLAHYLEHMGFNGSKHFPEANQVIEDLQKIGVAFGRDSNAHTSFDETVYKLDMPDNKPETLIMGLQVFADWAAYLHNNDKEVDDERGIILSEMRDRAGPQMRIWESIYANIFPGLNLGERFPIGTKKTIEEMKAEQLRAFYKKWYRPERMVLTVVGNIESNAVITEIKNIFGKIPKAEVELKHPDYGKFTKNDKIKFYAQHESEHNSTFIYYAVTKPHIYLKDGVDRRTLSLHKRLVNDIMSRRLKDYVEDNPDGSILSGGLSIYSRYGVDIAAFSVQPKPGQVLAATVVLEQELRRIREFGPSEQELKIAIANLKAGLEQSVARKSLRQNRSLAGQLYSSVKYASVFQTPEQNKKLNLELLESVELQDIQAAVDIAFNNGHQFFGIFGREDLGKDAAAQLERAFVSSASVQLQAPVEEKEVSWAYADRPSGGKIAEDKRINHNIRVLGFDNNVRASVLARDEKKNEVLMRLRIGFDNQPQQVGVREAFSAFMGGGLEKHTAKELRQVLAGKRARVNVSLGQHDIVIGGSCPPEELELMLQMARAWLTSPGWRGEEFKRLQTSWLERLAAEPTSLDATLGRRWSMLVGGGLPQNRSATTLEAKAVKWSQVIEWAQPILNTGAIELAIVGDVKEQVAVDLVKDYFGTLPKRHAIKIKTDLNMEGALRPIGDIPDGRFSFTVDATVKRAIIRVLWPTDDAGDVKLVRRLNQLGGVMSDKLRKKIREQLGDAYSPYAGNRSSGDYEGHGYFFLNVGVSPERVDEVVPILHEVVKDLIDNGIDDDLFKRVMEPTLKSLPNYRRGNGYWLGSVVARCQSQPQRIEWATNMEADYASINKEELSALAKEYLSGVALELIAVSHGKEQASGDPTTSE